MIVYDIIRPILELMVVIPGMILAYLPVKSYMKQPVGRIVSLMLPLLLGACVICGGISYRLNDSVGILLLLVAASAIRMMTVSPAVRRQASARGRPPAACTCS